MKRMTATAAAFVLAVLVLFTVNGKAQDFNPLEKTYLTFSGPVELPGMTLPAGTYTFKLADTPSRNVVQVMSRDEKTIHGQFLFLQAKRAEATGEPVVMFRENAEGTTPAVQYWFYPGESIGKEFIYPKDQATKIAARTHSKVLASDGDSVTTIDDSGNSSAVDNQASRSNDQSVTGESRGQSVAQATPAPAPRQEPTTPAPAAQAPASPAPSVNNSQNTRTSDQDTRTNTADRRVAGNELPRTASPLPITALLGMLSMAGGLSLRAFRQ